MNGEKASGSLIFRLIVSGHCKDVWKSHEKVIEIEVKELMSWLGEWMSWSGDIYTEEKSFAFPDRLCFVPRTLRMEGMVLGYTGYSND